MSGNYDGCLGDYERLEPWLGRCDACCELHLVDESYKAPRAACVARPRHPEYAWPCLGKIMFLTCLPEVAAAWRLGGPTAAWALYCEWTE